MRKKKQRRDREKNFEKIIYHAAVESTSLKHKNLTGPVKLSKGSRNYHSMSTMVYLPIRKHSITM